MQKRFVSIWLPYLATDWFTLRQPALKDIPFVLVAPDHGRKVITALSPKARTKGIYPGQTLADAKAVFPSLQHFDDKPGLVQQLLQRIAEWCIRFTPYAMVDPYGGILLDATGCTHLWNGEKEYITDIINRITEKGFLAKAAIADTIGCAWGMTRFGRSPIIENGKQYEALLPLPPEALRLDEDIAQRLRKLGLQQIKNFISIPRSALRRRFGPQLLQRIDQALGREEELITPVIPPEPYHERLPCMEPITRREGIDIALQKLLEQLCQRLQKENKGLRTATFKGYRIDGKTTSISISTNRPSYNVKHLFHLFGIKLDNIAPGMGIELFVLEANHTEDHIPPQEEFWKRSGPLEDIRISELIDRLTGKLGPDVIHRYLPDEHHWPERSYKKTTALTEKPATAWKTDKPRPLHLLPVPEQVDVTAPVPDYPPMSFRHKGRHHRIVKADGPERIEQEWWIQEGLHRDYYAVEDEEGHRYWLFRSGHYDQDKKDQWFLHGYFA